MSGEIKFNRNLKDRIRAVLRDCWGYDTLHDFQYQVIQAVMQNRDTFVLMATGSGKSLCYQVPSLLWASSAATGDNDSSKGKITLIISPLVSLIQDQVMSLQERGIRACFLASGDTSTASRVLAGRFTHVYLTPEKLSGWIEAGLLSSLHREYTIGLVAVDESHCVSEWGHDFRREFRRIHAARDVLPGVPFMCLTATATPRVRLDIMHNMRLDNPLQAVGSFNRPNLHYALHRKQSMLHDMKVVFVGDKQETQDEDDVKDDSVEEDEDEDEVAKEGKDSKDAKTGSNDDESDDGEDEDVDADKKESKTPDDGALALHRQSSKSRKKSRVCDTIVYCPTRKETEAVATLLTKQLGIQAGAYHAGMPDRARKEMHQAFVNDELDVLVATSAFGMGIDKPDIRRVVHYGAAKSLETYYQQTGRAGRDGQPSECVMFFSDGDFTKQARVMGLGGTSGSRSAKGSSSSSSSEGVSQTNQELLAKMREYCSLTQCRRRFLLDYFGEVLPTSTNCGNCDNCEGRTKGQFVRCDMTNDVFLLVSAVQQIGGGKFGLGMPVDVLLGSRRKKVVAKRLDKVPCHGKGRVGGRDAEFWKRVGRALMDRKILLYEKQRKSFTLTALDPSARDWLRVIAQQKQPLPRVELELPADFVRKYHLLSGTQQQQQDGKKQMATATNATSTSASAVATVSGALTSNRQRALYSILRQVRADLAKQRSLIPHLVFHNEHLMDMARREPENIEELLDCRGVGQRKAETYGKQILAAIESFVKQQSTLSSAATGQSASSLPSSGSSPDPPPAAAKVGAAAQDSLHRLLNGTETLEQLAAAKKIQERTIVDHLCTALASKTSSERVTLMQQHWARFEVPPASQQVIDAAIQSLHGTLVERARQIKDLVPRRVSYRDIRFCLLRQANDKLAAVACTNGSLDGSKKRSRASKDGSGDKDVNGRSKRKRAD